MFTINSTQDERPNRPLSRREFLKLSGVGFLGAALPSVGQNQQVQGGQQGRVIDGSIKIYDIPSFSGNSVKLFWHDQILPISGVTIGDTIPDYNRIWYRIGTEGYAHSGSIQPVRTLLNEPVLSLPPQGNLVEVTVPFTDAHRLPDRRAEVAYRFYYETTHWVIGLMFDSEQNPWYQVQDDKWEEFQYYVPAAHLRLVPKEELTAISPHILPSDKRIEVNIRKQIVIAYERDRPVFATRTATGAKFSNGTYYTPIGRHSTFHKRPSRHMARGNLAANGFDLPGVPWVSYFTKSGVAFHGTYWHNDYGQPRSHGCVNLTSQASKWIYRWTMPFVPPEEQRTYQAFGTIVDVL
jgi:lipoprotein-anchoring transpeptidase ErfK/SrfK